MLKHTSDSNGPSLIQQYLEGTSKAHVHVCNYSFYQKREKKRFPYSSYEHALIFLIAICIIIHAAGYLMVMCNLKRPKRGKRKKNEHKSSLDASTDSHSKDLNTDHN